jgi:serine/threonine-protein kinase
MAEVVLAEHMGLGKLVVVKLLHEQFAKDPGLTTRMQIEARSVAALTSPHIVQVTDLGQTATGRTYIVMERLVGRTLAKEVKERGALPFLEAIDYVVQVLAGLEAAHAMGIIHRDIKPDNIFLCDATKNTPRLVKVLDFGIAKVLEVAVDAGRPALPHLVTAAGSTLGTPRMFAPEQALAEPVDARTDIYSTGLLLYTLLTGRRPFAHITTEIELLKASVNERLEPPSTTTQNHVPPALDAAVLRAVEKEPGARFQSAEAFASELRRIAAEFATPQSARQATTGPIPLASVAAVDVPAADGRSNDLTVQLAPAKSELALVVQGDVPLSGTDQRRAHAVAGAPSARHRDRASWAAFVALTLLGAVISVILLCAAYRVNP